MLRKEKTVFVCFIFFLSGLISLTANSQLPRSHVDSIARRLTTAKDDSNKVTLLMILVNEVGYYDLKKALEYAQQGYALSKKIGYDAGVGHTSYSMGYIYTDRGSHYLADSFLNIAEETFTRLNDKKNLYKVSNARGNRHYLLGNYWQSADHFAKAAQGFDELKDTVLSLIAYQNLIAVLGQTKQHEKAVSLSKKVLRIVETGNDTLQKAYTLQALTNDLIHLNKLDEAGQHLLQLLAIADNTLDNNIAAESYGTAGSYYYERKDYQKAIDFFTRAIEKSGDLDNKYQLANHYNSLGRAHHRSGAFEKAKVSLLMGMVIARQFANKRAESDIGLSLSSLYDSAADYKNAYTNLLRHTELNDSLLNAEARNYTSYLETQFETNKKENEILRLQKVQQQNDFEIKRRNAYIGIGVVLVIVLIVILYLIKRNYKNKQKLSQQQSILLEEKIKTIEKEQQISSLQSMINGQETERTRIARDLHDGLGGIFSTIKMHYSSLQQDTPHVKDNPIYRKTSDLINTASDELRKVAHNMMPEVLMKVGVVEALQDFCNNISSGKLLLLKLQAYGMEKRLVLSTEIMLYRIIQELVNNIIKHADATEAIIQFNREGNRLSITIEDNGRGFDTREAAEGKTMGMATVKSRVDYLNGKLTIDSRKDVGTTVMIDLLLNEN